VWDNNPASVFTRMASDPKRDKQSTRTLLTGTAQPVTNTVERAREHFKGHPEPSRPPSKERKNFRKRKPEIDGVEEGPAEPEANRPESDGEEEGTGED
jgi:hypothetical protein